MNGADSETVRVCSAATSCFHLIDHNRGSFQEILSRLVPISQIDSQQRTACAHTILAFTQATVKVNRNRSVVQSYRLLCVSMR